MVDENAYEGHGGPPRGDSDESAVMPESFGQQEGRKPSTAGTATDTGDPAGINWEELNREDEKNKKK